MAKYTKVPAITGKKLIRLLRKDGWEIKRLAQHGVALAKTIGARTRVSVIPDTNVPLDEGTLAAILGPKQTGIGKRGLLDLINKFGI